MSSVTITRAPRRGLIAFAISTDHKVLVARLFVMAFGWFALAGILALLMRTQLATPQGNLFGHMGYNELFTMHGSTMIYLFAMPMVLALGAYLVPLQIGAADLAWSRVALIGFWMILGGGLIMWSGWFTVNGAASAGWYAYDPLSDRVNTPGNGEDFWIIGVLLAAFGAFLIAACILVTIVRRRAPGMSMLRLLTFSWTMVVTCLMVLTAFPPLIAAMALLLVQRAHGGIYTAPNGPFAYQQLFWFFGHPVVYIIFFPVLGAVSEVIATSSGRRWVRLQAVRVLASVLRRSVDVCLGSPLNDHGRCADPLLRAHLDRAACPCGDRIFRLVGDDVAGSDSHHGRNAVRDRVPADVPRRRAERDLDRVAAAELPDQRQLLHRRAFPLHAVRRIGVRDVRRDLLLVPQGHRAAARRGLGPSALRAHHDRGQSHVPADVLARRRWDAEAGGRLSGVERVAAAQRPRNGWLVHPGGVRRGVCRKHRRLAEAQRRGRT